MGAHSSKYLESAADLLAAAMRELFEGGSEELVADVVPLIAMARHRVLLMLEEGT